MAAALTKTASSESDWKFIKTKWEEALSWAKKVSADDEDYLLAKRKIIDYQTILNSLASKNSTTQSTHSNKIKTESIAEDVTLTPELAYDNGAVMGSKYCEGLKKAKTFEGVTSYAYNNSNKAIFRQVNRREKVYGESDIVVQAFKRGLKSGKILCEDAISNLICSELPECQDLKQATYGLVKNLENSSKFLKQERERIIKMSQETPNFPRSYYEPIVPSTHLPYQSP